MKNRHLIQPALSVLALAIAAWCLYRSYASRKIAFVDISRFTNEYRLKKDLEQAGTKNLTRIKYVIDSLTMIRQRAIRDGLRSPVDTPLAYANDAFERYYVQSNQEISRQVWERANPVMMQYGKEHGLELLVGANGQGTVLYGSASLDVTDDVIQFANQRYDGLKK